VDKSPKEFSMKNVFKTFGNLNQNQRSKVQFLIIALIAIIGFSMLGCSTDDDNNSDNNKTEVKIYTLSLDKVDDRTFTITLEGGTWKPDSSITADYSGLRGVASTALQDNILLADFDGLKQVRTTVSSDFNFTRSSSTMVTYTLKSERSNLKGTLELKVDSSNTNNTVGDWYISGCDYDAMHNIPATGRTYRVEANTAKKRITF
jgi:hypothetical protein